jgi:hypothetical protein
MICLWKSTLSCFFNSCEKWKECHDMPLSNVHWVVIEQFPQDWRNGQ